MRRPVIIEIICYAFFFLFVYASFAKLFIYPTYLRDLGRSPLIGNFAFTLSVAVPAVELMIAIILLIPRYRQQGLIASFVLMTLFSLYVAYVVCFAEKRPCSCGGIFRDMGWSTHLVFNIGMTILACIGIGLNKKSDEVRGGVTTTSC
ncbi:MauE/DoxX family redox-associated membrane protein [Chitinophaga nivalis]|uniref:MauE/DoxX family redox-associated membrane protein n=1 Tax=Chitinophaga nivalis TaxID=2991709 RepID=UPI0035311996